MLQESLIIATPELTASVRMQYHRPSALTLPDGHLHSTNNHLPILTMMHRPTHDELAEQVDDYAQIQLAFIGLQLGNIRDPFGLRFQSQEIPLQMIAYTRRWQARLCAHAMPLLAWPARNAVDRHQARNPVLARRFAFVSQILMHARNTDNPVAVLMDRSDPLHQTLIVVLPWSG